MIDLTEYTLLKKLKQQGYEINDLIKKKRISKLNPVFLTRPGGGLGVVIFPRIEGYDITAWMGKFENYLSNLIDNFKKLIQSGLNLQLHIVIGSPGIPLPHWFLEELERLGVEIVQHHYSDLNIPDDLHNIIRLQN